MIYLDNAATTYPKPENVVRAMSRSMKMYGANPGRGGHNMSVKTAEKIYETRSLIADMFNADGDECVCFTLNCSYALNMALKGTVKKGDHVLTSDLEHNAVMRPLFALKERNMITYDNVRTFGLTENEIIENFEKKINIHTSCIICTCMSNVTGTILPIERIGKLCKDYGLKFIVDGAQGAGIIPIDMKRMNINCLCMPGHKGLYGPMGTGILIVREDDDILRTIIEGGTGNMSYSLGQPEESPERFESGTQNAVGIIALGEGVKFVRKKGTLKIWRHEIELVRRLYNAMSKVDRVQLYTPEPVFQECGPVLPMNVTGLTSEETAEILNKRGIAVRAGLHCAPIAHQTLGTIEGGVVRVSPSAFNSNDEIDYFIRTIYEIIGTK